MKSSFSHLQGFHLTGCYTKLERESQILSLLFSKSPENSYKLYTEALYPFSNYLFCSLTLTLINTEIRTSLVPKLWRVWWSRVIRLPGPKWRHYHQLGSRRRIKRTIFQNSNTISTPAKIKKRRRLMIMCWMNSKIMSFLTRLLVKIPVNLKSASYSFTRVFYCKHTFSSPQLPSPCISTLTVAGQNSFFFVKKSTAKLELISIF